MTLAKRLRVALGLVLLAVGVALAVIPDDWIETASGWSPDGGDGLAEAAIAGVPIALGCLLISDFLFTALRRGLELLGNRALSLRR